MIDESGEEVVIPTTLDDSMSVAGNNFASGGEIPVSLVIN